MSAFKRIIDKVYTGVFLVTTVSGGVLTVATALYSYSIGQQYPFTQHSYIDRKNRTESLTKSKIDYM